MTGPKKIWIKQVTWKGSPDSLLHCLFHNLITAFWGISYDWQSGRKARSEFIDICKKMEATVRSGRVIHYSKSQKCLWITLVKSNPSCGKFCWEIRWSTWNWRRKKLKYSYILITVFVNNSFVGWSGIWIEQDMKICDKKVLEGSLGRNSAKTVMVSCVNNHEKT